ncbi:integrase arm-type DNA-binding domain-containing protein [Burkholderia stagnalis]
MGTTYTSRGFQQSRISPGCYLEISLQQARLDAAACPSLIAKGIDPRTERRNQKRSDADDLFSTSAELCLKRSKRDSGRASSTPDKFRTYLDKDILRCWGTSVCPTSRARIAHVFRSGSR